MEPPRGIPLSSVGTLSSDRVVLLLISNHNALCKSSNITKLSTMVNVQIMKEYESIWTVFRVSSSKLGLDIHNPVMRYSRF